MQDPFYFSQRQIAEIIEIAADKSAQKDREIRYLRTLGAEQRRWYRQQEAATKKLLAAEIKADKRRAYRNRKKQARATDARPIEISVRGRRWLAMLAKKSKPATSRRR